MTALWLLLAAGLLSWVMRVLFIAVLPADRLPGRARQILTGATPAVLAALTVVLAMNGLRAADGTARVSHIAAIAVAAVLAWWKGNVTLVVFGAMTAATVVQLIL